MKLRDKLLEEMEIDVPKVVKQTQENTYDRKNRKEITLEALISK